MKHLMLIVGALAVLLGLLWIGQGMGWLHWPSSSFMIGARQWTYIGAIVAILGIGLIGLSRRQA